VTLVDAGLRRDLDLQVVSPVEHFGPLPERSVWPSIHRRLREEIQRHRSTIIFANNRRMVESLTSHLNERPSVESLMEHVEQTHGQQSVGLPETDLARAHHGSVALEVRQQTEQALKEGRLAAVVATASLELGIDMGAVDLVCQVESPGSVARGLQRVGRAGHVVGQRSKGRLIAKTPGDLTEQAVLAREMAAGRVEEIRVPVNCLDVLAQQVVAMTALQPWDVPVLYGVVRRAYPYRDLTPTAFESVLEVISGRYVFGPDAGQAPKEGTRPARSVLAALTPRVSWDRVHNRLSALPGTQQLALVSGGTIPDTGQYAAYAPNGVRIGELDEEFIYERRVGDAFLLGTNAWRIERIEADRVLVTPAEGAPAIVPFWRGENVGRTFDLGMALGRFLRELAQRLDAPDTPEWLQTEYFLDAAGARNLCQHVRRQLLVTGNLPTDRTLTIEASRDPLGDWQVILLSPFGGRVHLALRFALETLLSQRLGYRPQCLHHNDGLLIRLTDTDEPILDLFEGLTAESVTGLILDALADSALFALRFRQNAARALLLPRAQPGKRAPLWLQRLRSRDLLQVARKHADFPIVAETFRECLHDHLDVPRLQLLLDDIRAGRIAVIQRRADGPSPFAGSLLFAFTASKMYEYDRTDADQKSATLDHQLLEQLVAPDRNGHLLDPRAVHQVERRLRGVGQPPRSVSEMAEWLRRLGDLTAAELEGPMAAFLTELEADGRATRLVLPAGREPERWVLTEGASTYRHAFGLEAIEPAEQRTAAETVLARFLATHALVGLADVLARYPFDATWARRVLEEWARSGRLVSVKASVETVPVPEPERFAAPEIWEQVQRSSLAMLRRDVTTCPPAQFVDFLLRWQYVHPDTRRGAAAGLAAVLDRLQGLPVPAAWWEQVILPARVPEYQPRWLDEAVASGAWTWAGQGNGDAGPGLLAFWRREDLASLAAPVPTTDTPALQPEAERVLDRLRERGASFVIDLAHDIGLSPSVVRLALWQLLRRRLATNDHFDVVRRGEERPVEALAAGPLTAMKARRRESLQRPEGRWSLLPWGRPEPENHAIFQASVLLQRYGIIARELALMDETLLPWRVLYEVLARMELTGEVRRGYFVEGMSGAQFALPEAARMLADTALPATAAAPVVLLHSLDPANLYGSGAPFDIPLLDGGTRPLLRRAGNWLVVRAGRPLLIAEQQGRRLTALPSASRDDVTAAVARLPDILAGDRSLAVKHKLSVAEWNGQPVTATEGRELLEASGFVRDYQEMTLYAACR
jgi:ATP-dependent Lhr-like helicase